jgi:hypothetical protein
MVTTPDRATDFPKVRKLWSGVEVTNFGAYYEALQVRLLDYIWNDESLKQEILTNPKVVFERETGITFPADVEVKVLEEPENTFYFVVPATPPAEEHWYRYEQFAGWWQIIDTFWYFYYRLGGSTKARAYRECFQALWIVRSWTNETFRKQLLDNPRSIFEGEMGIPFPAELKIQSLEETPNRIYFILPKSPLLEKLDETATVGEWWKASHGLWWWYTSLRFRQPATKTVTGVVG